MYMYHCVIEPYGCNIPISDYYYITNWKPFFGSGTKAWCESRPAPFNYALKILFLTLLLMISFYIQWTMHVSWLWSLMN